MMFSINGLQFSYRSTSVIHDTSFEVTEGEILAILGRNGAGKTTLLKCLNRVLHPQGGTVELDGKDLVGMRPVEIARKIGWVPQREAVEDEGLRCHSPRTQTSLQVGTGC